MSSFPRTLTWNETRARISPSHHPTLLATSGNSRHPRTSSVVSKLKSGRSPYSEMKNDSSKFWDPNHFRDYIRESNPGPEGSSAADLIEGLRISYGALQQLTEEEIDELTEDQAVQTILRELWRNCTPDTRIAKSPQTSLLHEFFPDNGVLSGEEYNTANAISPDEPDGISSEYWDFSPDVEEVEEEEEEQEMEVEEEEVIPVFPPFSERDAIFSSRFIHYPSTTDQSSSPIHEPLKFADTPDVYHIPRHGFSYLMSPAIPIYTKRPYTSDSDALPYKGVFSEINRSASASSPTNGGLLSGLHPEYDFTTFQDTTRSQL